MSVSQEYSQSLRLCHISKWDHFDGYGFNLHAEKGKNGQYIGKVDEDSPAEAAGLKEGDRIIEVNGANINNENHKQVVNRIKSASEETELLVVDPEGDAYFKSNNVELNSSLPYVVNMKTPIYNHIEKPETDSKDIQIKESESTVSAKKEQDLNNVKTQEEVISSKPDSAPDQVITEKTIENNTLNLNMTARELRAQLAARKKYDPKKDYSLDVKKKYDIVQKL